MQNASNRIEETLDQNTDDFPDINKPRHAKWVLLENGSTFIHQQNLFISNIWSWCYADASWNGINMPKLQFQSKIKLHLTNYKLHMIVP